MSAISSDNLLSALQWRYAVKKFDPTRKLTDAQWATLEQALILSPSSFGLQPWKFVVITDAAIRKQLTAASWGQTQISDCSHLVVFAGRTSVTVKDIDTFVAQICAVRGASKESLAEYRDMMVGALTSRPAEDQKTWAAKQCYIALGNLLTSAATLGIDVCPMEGIDPAKYDQLLKRDALEGFSTLMVAAVGFRHPEDGYAKLKKVRFSPSQVVVKI